MMSHAHTHTHTHTHAHTHTLRRFDTGMEKCFENVIEFFKENPQFLDYLTDKGTRKVSRKYNAQWEMGFRNAALTK